MKKTNMRLILLCLAIAAPLFALDPISGSFVNAIYGAQENTAAGDSLKAMLEKNVFALFKYRAAGQTRHPDILSALAVGVQLLHVQYDQREGQVTSQAQWDSLANARARLDNYQHLLDSLNQIP